jgi:hypothetical protein
MMQSHLISLYLAGKYQWSGINNDEWSAMTVISLSNGE